MEDMADNFIQWYQLREAFFVISAALLAALLLALLLVMIFAVRKLEDVRLEIHQKNSMLIEAVMTPEKMMPVRKIAEQTKYKPIPFFVSFINLVVFLLVIVAIVIIF